MQRHRILPLAFAGLLLLGLAGQAVAAPPSTTPAYAATLKVSRDCVFTTTVTWKNADVGHIYVAWFEAGFANPIVPDHVATSDWPNTVPGSGTAKGKSVVFNLGPVDLDTASHDWWVIVSFYSPQGALLAQRQPALATNCYLVAS